MKVLLLSAYTAESHRYWIDGLESNFSEIKWTILILPPRYFSWRIRGNSLTWAFSERKKLSDNYDLVLATSMVDLSSLRGMIPNLAQIPTIVYFHENQFAYPESHKAKQNRPAIEPQIVNLYSAVCADRMVFNSQYNQQSFLYGIEKLARQLPDGVPKELVNSLRIKSEVLPVPLSHKELNNVERVLNESPTLIWNHRWEYDKGPERFYLCLQNLTPKLNLKIHVVGQSFRQQPDVFAEIKNLLEKNDWSGKWGYVESREEYLQLLSNSNIVLSTAMHDFQGLSVLEGFYLGCVPIVPKRLAYVELFSDLYFYPSDVEDSQNEAKAAALKIEQALQDLSKFYPKKEQRKSLDWDYLKPHYQTLFDKVINQFQIAD